VIVLLHGVPENPSVWDPLRARLAERSLETDVLELPGFVSTAPPGFTGTKDWYGEWLVSRLEQYDEPVDVVSHDWGSPLTLWVAAHRPELLHSWVADGMYMLHEGYRWHTLARVWQTPVVGPAFWLVYLNSPARITAGPYRRFGLDDREAEAVVRMGNRTMARSVARLYRSAAPNIHASWGDLSAAGQVPGLVIEPGHDEFGSPEHAAEIARRLGATVEHFADLGHWWALQAPERAAATLVAFWESLD
jgi:pimeloyl-ACP methyl ester carboxylesterase